VDRAIRLWDVATGKQRHVFDGHTGAASGVAFVAGGKSLASAGADGTVRLWDVTSGKELLQFQGQHVGVGSLAVSTDGTAVVSVGVDHTVRFWDAATAGMLPAIRGQVGAGETLRFGLGLDGIQQANASQRLMCPGWVALLRLEKTATGVCPTAYMGCAWRAKEP
jgi:WD40 repeat protein